MSYWWTYSLNFFMTSKFNTNSSWMCFDFWTFLPAAFLDCRWKEPRNLLERDCVAAIYLQHIPSNPEAHDHPCAWQPCLALSLTKCIKPSVKRWLGYHGKLPKLQLQQLRPLVEFRCSQVHLFGSPVKIHHPPFSSWETKKSSRNYRMIFRKLFEPWIIFQ